MRLASGMLLQLPAHTTVHTHTPHTYHSTHTHTHKHTHTHPHTFLMVFLWSWVSLSLPECLISSCLMAVRKVSWEEVTLPLNWAQILFERRVALSPPISVRTYLVRHSLSNFWPLGEEPCVCVCEGGGGSVRGSGGRLEHISSKQKSSTYYSAGKQIINSGAAIFSAQTIHFLFYM